MDDIPLRTPAAVGALMKARRRARGLDQAGLADRIGVSRLWVNQVERGKPGASLGRVLRALAALGVELTGRAPDPLEQNRPLTSAPVVTPDIDAIVAEARRRPRS
ncbi:MAG: helix-turn-helix domain-containing protein [Acetobacteraceae bacterium]